MSPLLCPQLHCALTEETRHIINEETLKLMKPTAILVNTARGGCVDMAAVKVALDENRLGGAGIDVLEVEQMDDFVRGLGNAERAHTPTTTESNHHIILQLPTLLSCVACLRMLTHVFRLYARGYAAIPITARRMVFSRGFRGAQYQVHSRVQACGAWTELVSNNLCLYFKGS